MNPWPSLEQSKIEAIHQATLRVLAETGIVLSHPRMRQLLVDAGCSLYNSRIQFPASLVEKSILTCGKGIRIAGRDGNILKLGFGDLHWHNLGGARDLFDPLSGQPRPARIVDVRESTRLLDALDQVDSITPFFTPRDVPGELMALAMYRYALPNTTKPIQGPGVHSAAEVDFIVKLAEVVGSPQQMLTLSASPVSPLTFADTLVDAMIAIAEKKIAFAPLPCPTAGTTAPFSLAGALTQQNAEVLASLVMVNLIQPGLPVMYCGRLAMMEPRSGNSVWGGVELGIASAATVQLGHNYHLPVNVYGLTTNAHTLDLQNGYERAMNALLPALAGADELSGIGEMDAGVMGSYAQMVVDNQIAVSIGRVRRGFVVDQDSLAVEVIQEVMNTSHTFLAERHSVKYLRSGEVLLSKLAERRSFSDWDQTGRKSFVDNAQAEANRLLANHEVPPLENAQEHQLDQILKAAFKALVNL